MATRHIAFRIVKFTDSSLSGLTVVHDVATGFNPMMAFVIYGLAAIVCAASTLFVLKGGYAQRRDRGATAVALSVTTAWCGMVAAFGPASGWAQAVEILRNIAWIYALFRHFANDGRDEQLRLVRQVVSALITVEALQFVLLALDWRGTEAEVGALLRMLVAVGTLFLIHNLYGGASAASRSLLAWNSAGFALLWLFELNLYTVAYLSGDSVGGLYIMRGLVTPCVAMAFAIGSTQGARELSFRPSRAVAFSTLSLAVLAVYFIAMVGLADGVARLSGDLARVVQVGFLLLAATVALVWLPSPRLRATARVLALKHLFKHRYDYRAEWLRFTSTIGSSAGQGATLNERAIQSLGDITDSSAGLLLLPGDDGDLQLASRWHWSALDVPARALPYPLVRLLQRETPVVALDEARAGVDHFGEGALIPEWLLEAHDAWALVPLLHGERLVGAVVLARPQLARRLDWEDYDLLGIAGQQVASYLSEQAGLEALQDAASFEEFNRRMAFVMHDIKNLSSQLGLLSRNAERHAENPAFRKDMLVTLRNSADKLDAMVSRLGRYGSKSNPALAPIDLRALADRVAHRYSAERTVICSGESACTSTGNADLLEQALIHLVQNAIEASAPDAPVALEVRSSGLRGTIAVVDSGEGMSAHFIRTGLFRPFVSTKQNGFGIGVCEARDHIRGMGGRLEVESREGIGSRFTISLPLVEASRLIGARGEIAPPLQNEKAA